MFVMNKLFTLIAFTIYLILLPHNISAQCHINDWTGLKALYESTSGDNWTNKTGWDMQIANHDQPPQNCNLPDLYGVEVALGRVWKIDLSGNGLSGNIPDELVEVDYLAILKLDANHLCGIIPAALGDLSFLTQLQLNDNALSGCYSFNLSQLCNQLEQFLIYGGDNSVASWDDFCNTNFSLCQPNETYSITVGTDYSGIVDMTTTFDQSQDFILTNNSVQVMHYPNCYNINNCAVVNNFENNAANEVLWATEKAVLFFAGFSNFNIPKLKSFTHSNYNNQHNAVVLNNITHTIYYGSGDNIERNSMTAPDIVGRTFTNYLANQSDEILSNLSDYSESGALKESFADIFGEMVEDNIYGDNDWVIGSQVMASQSGLAGIRSLSNPSANTMLYQLPDTYKGQHWLSDNLNCETEGESLCTKTNNGVQNYWFYLLAEGGNGVNDIGEAYNVNGIGKTLATELAFESFNTLKPNATYYDMVLHSVNIAKTEFSNNSTIATQAANAWEAVGLDVERVSEVNNPIGLRLGNYQINGVSQFTNSEGVEMMPRWVDLIIDSLDQDINADQLQITMQIPSNFTDVKIDYIYPPLTADQLSITYNEDEITVLINRQNAVTGKTNSIFTIPSGSSLFRVGICIEVIDLGVIDNNNTLSVVKYDQNIIDESKTEHLFIVEDVNNSNSLTLSNKLIHQDCLALGNIETAVMNSINPNSPPYNFYLYNSNGVTIDSELSKNDYWHNFTNLKEGTYGLRVEDGTNQNMEFNFNVVFEARRNGSTCCPDKLFIPSGDFEGSFNASDRIEIKTNTTIKSGSLYICN